VTPLSPPGVAEGGRDTTTRDVLALALPALASGFVDMAQHWVNQLWVGHLDTESTAALSVATFGVWAYNGVTLVLAVGLAALVGRYAGAGREGAARWVGLQGLRWAWPVALVAAVLGWLLAPPAFDLAGTGPDATRQGVLYLRLYYGGGVAATALAACDAVWRGHGTTKPSLAVAVGILALNALLDPLLIFGLGPVPALGVAGAAVASVLSKSAGAIVSFRLLARRGHLSRERPSDDELRFRAETPLAPGPFPALDLSVARRALRIGLPVLASSVFFVAVYLLVSHVVTEAGGDAAVAGLGAGLKGEQVAFYVGNGFAAAAAALVARRLGAGRSDLASRAAWRATWLASAACVVWGAALLLGGRWLVDAFLSGSPEAVPHARLYVSIVAPCLAFQAWEHVLEGAFGGAGMTVPPMLVSMALTAARVPLARWAAFDQGWGVAGIWAVIAATAALRGVVVALWFARGTWTTRSV
jgi:putative MATE family efflux protein